MNKKKRVLVADDEEQLVKVLTDRLEQDDIETLTASDGKETLELALKEKPDLILLDIIMPSMSGWEVLEKLREDEWGKKVPVILLTNLDDMDSVSKAVEGSAQEFLIKTDWEIDDVAKKVKARLRESE